MLINIKKYKELFKNSVYQKAVHNKYGISTPYCEHDILEAKLIKDLSFYFDTQGINRSIDDIDVNNLLKNVYITFNSFSSSNHYTHNQTTDSSTWTVIHELGFNPVVQVFTKEGVAVEFGMEILVSNYSLKIFVNPAMKGIAECSI